MREVKVGHLYKHFKGKKYKVLMIAIDASTEEKLVIYQAQYKDKSIWARPYNEFISEVDQVKYPNVKEKYRFEEIN